jgi:archaemetzincin
MKIALLQVGEIAPEVLAGIQQGLTKTFPDTTCSVIKQVLPVPQHAFDKKRSQYNSSLVLSEVKAFQAKKKGFHKVLGVADVDIFFDGLTYVFGEAYAPGEVALISLWRLKPLFYGDKSDIPIFLLRAVKEAVHEVGHTLGLQHCPRSFCVMHFSNSVFDTDKKQNLLCDECYLKAAIAITNIG